jgi:hypothetical protein
VTDCAPPCLCCGQPTSITDRLDGWCTPCAGAVLADVLAMRDGPPAVVGFKVGVLRGWGCEAICAAITGQIPFDFGAMRE